MKKKIKLMVSGGPDSVAMLLKYHKVADSVIHVNHGIRPDSGEDAKFVQELCDKLGIKCWVYTLALGTDVSENDAREARLNIMAERAKIDSDAVFYTAHTMDDVAETVLFNLFRGAGVFGACSLKEDVTLQRKGVSVHVHRPMLKMRKTDILSFLKEENQEYKTDSTNNTDLYTRNCIRNKLIPLASMIMDRDVVPSICKFADNAQELDDMLDNCEVPFIVMHETTDPTGRFDPFAGSMEYIDCKTYAETPFNKHLLIKFIKASYNVSKFTKKHWDAVDAALTLGASTKISLPGFMFVIRKKQARFERNSK